MDSSQSPSLNDQRGPNRTADSRAIAIHVSPHDQLANYPPSFGRRTFLTLANFFIAARDRLPSYRPSFGRRTSATLASFFIATLIGVAAALVWQSQRVSTPNDVVIAEKQSDFTPVGQLSLQVAPPQPAPVTQTAPASTAPATSPELVQQLEGMARDLVVLRRSVEELVELATKSGHAYRVLIQINALTMEMISK